MDYTVFFLAPLQPLDSGNQSDFVVAGGFISFCTDFKYLGSIISQLLTSETDIHTHITKATTAFGVMQHCFFQNKLAICKDKGSVFVALVLSSLIHGPEFWCLRKDLF